MLQYDDPGYDPYEGMPRVPVSDAQLGFRPVARSLDTERLLGRVEGRADHSDDATIRRWLIGVFLAAVAFGALAYVSELDRKTAVNVRQIVRERR